MNGEHLHIHIHVEELTQLISLFRTPSSDADIRTMLGTMHRRIDAMNAQLQAFFVAQKARNAQEEAAITTITARQAEQAALIKQLQESPGTTWTSEDQANLDALEASTQNIATELQNLATVPVPTPPATA